MFPTNCFQTQDSDVAFLCGQYTTVYVVQRSVPRTLHIVSTAVIELLLGPANGRATVIACNNVLWAWFDLVLEMQTV